MDALILSCGTGGGHNAAGAAVLHELQRRGHHAEMLDPYSLKSDRTALRISHTYVGMVQRSPAVFGAVYHLGNAYRRLPFRSPVYHLNKRMIPVMQDYLSRHHFDAVVMPHLFPAEIFTALRNAGLPCPKTVFVATDYTCIPFTEETDCDGYVIPSPELTGEFSARGIPAERLHPFGIPVEKAFSSPMTQQEAKCALGLDAEKKYILTFGGSMGAGCLRQVISLLLEHYDADKVQVITVCGSNRRLYDALYEEYGNTVRILSYTDRMPEYMRACDLIVCKPGGLSSTEAAVTGTALVHLSPISGCEDRNMSFFSAHGMCAAVTNPAETLTTVCDRLLLSDEREAMLQKQRACINPHAAADICDYLEKLCASPQSL